MEQSKEKDWHQDQSNRGSGEEQHGEHQIVSSILRQKLTCQSSDYNFNDNKCQNTDLGMLC